MRVMNMQLLRSVFVITAAVFLTQGSTVLFEFFNSNMRWFFLAFLWLCVFFTKAASRLEYVRLFLILGAYFSWCFLTFFWSEVPILTLLKSGSLFLTATPLILSGMTWCKAYSEEKSLNWLFLTVILVMISGVSGKANFFGEEAQYYDYGGNMALYQGLFNNPNAFGIAIAMIAPFLLWHLYLNWNFFKKRCLFGFLFVLSLVYLLESHSRGSIVVFLSVVFFFFMSFHVKKKINFLVSFVFVGIIISLFFGEIIFQDLTAYVYKRDSASFPSPYAQADVFKTRRNVWQDSYDGAIAGGWLGAGYGVSVGATAYKFSGFATGQYGREKGNSQLAIIEETGIVGLIIYILLLSAIFPKIFISWYKATGSQKVLRGLVLGVLLGIFFESFFEAWWGAPGSPESVYFWCFVGVANGLTSRKRKGSAIGYATMETPLRPLSTPTP